jgi:hypothetical protein
VRAAAAAGCAAAAAAAGAGGLAAVDVLKQVPAAADEVIIGKLPPVRIDLSEALG